MVTDGKLKPVKIGNLKQEYLEDRWDILEMIKKLNSNEEIEVEQTNFTERTREKIEEKNNSLFDGLL